MILIPRGLCCILLWRWSMDPWLVVIVMLFIWAVMANRCQSSLFFMQMLCSWIIWKTFSVTSDGKMKLSSIYTIHMKLTYQDKCSEAKLWFFFYTDIIKGSWWTFLWWMIFYFYFFIKRPKFYMKTSGYFNLDPGVELIGFYPYMVEKEAGLTSTRFCL